MVGLLESVGWELDGDSSQVGSWIPTAEPIVIDVKLFQSIFGYRPFIRRG